MMGQNNYCREPYFGIVFGPEGAVLSAQGGVGAADGALGYGVNNT